MFTGIRPPLQQARIGPAHALVQIDCKANTRTVCVSRVSQHDCAVFDHVGSVQRYSTCTLNHWENEGVCEQLLLRSDCERIELQPLRFPVDLSGGIRWKFNKKGTERTGISSLGSSKCQITSNYHMDHSEMFGIILSCVLTCSSIWFCHSVAKQLGFSLWRTLMATPVGCGRLLCCLLSQARSCHPIPRWTELGTCETVEYIGGDGIETFGAGDVGFLAFWWGPWHGSSGWNWRWME